MRTALRSTLAAALLGTASLLAACGTSPVEPAAPNAAPVNSAYTVSWGAKTPAPGDRLHSGYTVSWGAKAPAPTERLNSGYTVSWGAKGQPAPTDRLNSGYTVSWGRGQVQP